MHACSKPTLNSSGMLYRPINTSEIDNLKSVWYIASVYTGQLRKTVAPRSISRIPRSTDDSSQNEHQISSRPCWTSPASIVCDNIAILEKASWQNCQVFWWRNYFRTIALVQIEARSTIADIVSQTMLLTLEIVIYNCMQFRGIINRSYNINTELVGL
jgi:hypothetical protein